MRARRVRPNSTGVSSCEVALPAAKRLQSVGQMIGEVLKQLDEDRFIVKASSGPRYVVGVRKKVSTIAALGFRGR